MAITHQQGSIKIIGVEECYRPAGQGDGCATTHWALSYTVVDNADYLYGPAPIANDISSNDGKDCDPYIRPRSETIDVSGP
jgi:hypothetical protein